MVPLNGFDLYYDRDGNGPTIVYVHGGFATLATYLYSSDAYQWSWENDFTPHFDFIEYYRRGCYRSSCPKGGYDLLNQTKDLEALLNYLGLGAVNLIGSSAGGPISILFAATRPERVHSLILAGTGLNLFPQDDPITRVVKNLLEKMERENIEAAFEARPVGVETNFEVLWNMEGEMKERGVLEEYLEGQQRTTDLATALPHQVRLKYYAAELLNMAAYIGFDLVPFAARMKVPTMVLHGTHDRVVPISWGEELARTIPGAKLVKIVGGSHSLVIRSNEARKIIMDFLSN
jgi:3-oxoadipate enol-lactonase